MNRILVLLMLVAMGSGCKNIAGPFQTRDKPSPREPGLTIEEQERRARDKYAMPEDDRRIGPPGYNDRPGPIGR